MFALEFVDFVFNVREFSSMSSPFFPSPYSLLEPQKGLNMGFSSGVIPGDLYLGSALNMEGFLLRVLAYRSGSVLITTLPDTTKPPGPDNRPEVKDRVNFIASEIRLGKGVRLDRWTRLGADVKLVIARAGRYGYGLGGGLSAGGVLWLNPVVGFHLWLEDLSFSPVVWNTGRKEFTRPKADLRAILKKHVVRKRSYYWISFGLEQEFGVEFSLKKFGYASMGLDTERFSVFGGFIKGMPRLGASLRLSRFEVSVGSSYHVDFGFSFRSDLSWYAF